MEVSECEKHNIKKTPLKHPFKDENIFYCTECAAEEHQREERAKEERRRRESFDRRLHNAMISPRFSEKTLENYNATTEGQKKALSLANWFIENHGKVSGMIFIGKTGTGKNHLACGIIHKIIEQGGTALITTAMKIIRAIKDSWRDHETKEGDIINLYTQPGLLVIDEIGVQFGSDTEKLYISEIINDRYEAMRPTLLLGNIKLDELIEQLGDRPIDRFREGGKIVQFDWESHRKSKA
jgi:DNA replication protein DnaC